MTTSDSGRALVKEFEGFNLQAYQDGGGVWTIGYGHTGDDVHQWLIITDGDAENFLTKDLAGAEHTVNAAVKVPITQNQFDALVDFAFNLGGHALATSTLMRLLNEGDKMGAANEFAKWDHSGGKEVPGLLRRRLAERDLFLQEAA